MFNECLIHLLDCTCLNVMCVCSILYGLIQKDFWSFYMFLEVIFITLCVHVWCLLCFSLFKHVLYWKIGVRVFCGSAGDSLVAKPQSQVHPEAFGDSLAACSRLTRDSRKFSRLNLATRGLLVTHSQLAKIFTTEPRDSPSRETQRPEIAF